MSDKTNSPDTEVQQLRAEVTELRKMEALRGVLQADSDLLPDALDTVLAIAAKDVQYESGFLLGADSALAKVKTRYPFLTRGGSHMTAAAAPKPQKATASTEQSAPESLKKLFGKSSDAARANALAHRDPILYRRLRKEAIDKGIL